MIRVLIADDSATVRGHLVEMVSSDPRLQVAGAATDGEEAARLALELRPDVIIMDVTMPRLDGIAATERIMSTRPCPIVMISSSADDAEANVSFRALRAGALEILQKPGSLDPTGYEKLRRAVVETLVVMSEVRVVRRWPGGTETHERPSRERRAAQVVGICASTGGPAALELLLRGLPADFALPVVIVQHIAEGFTAGFVRWLQQTSAIPVEVAADQARLHPGRALVAPDDRHVLIQADGVVALSDALPVDHHRPSGTPLFSSMARAYGARSVGVIMTGMGADGTAGLRELHARGGHVIAQDPSTCTIPSMPNSAIRAGVAAEIVPLADIVRRLCELAAVRPAAGAES